MALAGLGASTALKRKGGNRLLGTRRGKNQPTGTSYNPYSLLGLSSLGVLIRPQAFSSSETSIMALKYIRSTSGLNNSGVKMNMGKKMI